MIMYPADAVGANGKVHETVGENIRYGAKGESSLYAIVNVEFGANAASEVTIQENHTGVNDLVAQVNSTFINFTSASHDIVNVVGVQLMEADGAFELASMATNSTGALAIQVKTSSAGDTATFKVFLKVDEY